MKTEALPHPKKPLLDRLPVASHIRQSVGLQRTMLLIGVVLCVIFAGGRSFCAAARAVWVLPDF
jgi:hypothetical protein